MREVRGWAESFVALASATFSLWRRLGPRILPIFAVTLVAQRAFQLLSIWACTWVPVAEYDDQLNRTETNHWNQWVAVGLLALSFLALLLGLVVILRIIGAELDGQRAAPVGERASFSRTLSITLLSFLGIYSVFDYISDTTSALVLDSAVLTGDMSFDFNYAALSPEDWNETLTVIAIIVGAFILRRILDLIGRKLARGWLGVAATALEAFYLLVFFVAGYKVVNQIAIWIDQREGVYSFRRWFVEVTYPLRWFGLNLPEALQAAWDWFWETGWPIGVRSFLLPMLWFALASLVLGSAIRSFGEILEGGSRLTIASARRREALVQLQDAVFGDLDEKYLPAWQAIKLTWKAGAGMLGSLVISFNLIELGAEWLAYAVAWLIGPTTLEIMLLYSYISQFFIQLLEWPLMLCMMGACYALSFNGGHFAMRAPARAVAGP
ncbi:MAG: hypothetical protein LBR21_07845 [Propionibacteriaceae bacterium]|jgi:hypothetical protein|nr:hypothetical protein [Propionibacteriaceae bacterium]